MIRRLYVILIALTIVGVAACSQSGSLPNISANSQTGSQSAGSSSAKSPISKPDSGCITLGCDDSCTLLSTRNVHSDTECDDVGQGGGGGSGGGGGGTGSDPLTDGDQWVPAAQTCGAGNCAYFPGYWESSPTTIAGGGDPDPSGAGGGSAGGVACPPESASAPGGGSCDPLVAENKGTPAPGEPCHQSDGTNSLAIGATVGTVNDNGTTQVRSVTQINQVDGVNQQTIANPSVIATSLSPIGWLYEDNNGGLWFQADPNAQWTQSVTVNVGNYLGITVSPPNVQTPVYLTQKPTQNTGVVTIKCWAGGAALAPGTLG